MNNGLEFKGFAKMNRFHDETMYISEKIDGTNAQLFIHDEYLDNEEGDTINPDTQKKATKLRKMLFGSRNRYVTPEDDNYGFASWAYKNAIDLLKLPPGRHYGEWWGQGVQRGYGLKEKKLSLFNQSLQEIKHIIPCIDFVPLLYQGPFNLDVINDVMSDLQKNGSKAAPGFMDVEGVVIYLKKSNIFFKRTFDDKHKWEKQNG